MHSAETPNETPMGADQTSRTSPSRRRLNDEQQREVARLYAETMTSVPDISKQFAIGESSVYRIAQRHGAPLRGRASSPPSAPAAPATPVAPAAPSVRRRAASRPTAAARPARSVRRPVAEAALHRFEVHFRAETVLEATDVSAALRQLESLGATEVIAIVRA